MPKKHASKWLALALLATGLVSLTAAGSASATFPGTNGKIAFASNRTGSYDIYAANPDGSGLVNLTATPGVAELDPAWSADGRRLAFQRDGAIWVMDADGGGQSGLTIGSSAGELDSAPAWSPAGDEIAFARSDTSGNSGIWVVQLGGGATRQVTALAGDTGTDAFPSWSPDGGTIAFQRNLRGSPRLLALVGAGGGPVQILNVWVDGLGYQGSYGHPSWSPDGTRIAVDVNGGENVSIFHPDGALIRAGVIKGDLASDPEWSPDGSALAYASFGEVKWQAFEGSASGSVSGGDPAVDKSPAWQPLVEPGLPAVSIGDAEPVLEGDAGTVAATFDVTLSAPSNGAVTVDFATADGTASAGDDYHAATGTLAFSPGQTQQTISVLVKGDTVAEPDEVFEVSLSNPAGATIGDGRGVATIRNDDSPRLSVGDATAAEDDAGIASMLFTLTLSSAAGEVVNVDVSTQDGTATSASDYITASGSVTFNPGETTKTFAVPLRADTQPEPDETFTLLLSNARGATILDGAAVGTIKDDDSLPALSAGFAEVTEGDSGTVAGTIGVGLSKPSTETVTVEYATVDGSAKAPGDYAPASGTLTFAPGETAKTITAFVKGDRVHETPEGFGVELRNPVAAKLRPGFGTGLIQIDDDDPYVGKLVVDSANPGVVIYDELVPTADTITVSSPAAGTIRLVNTAGPVAGSSSCTSDEAGQVDCQASKVVVDTGTLDDAVGVSGSIPSTLEGGAGADTLAGGSSDDVLSGGAGVDTLGGGSGDDVLSGGQNDDTLSGGAGTDTVGQTASSDMTLTTTSLTGSGTDALSGIEKASLASSGGQSPVTIDATAFTGTTVLQGMSGDTLLGGRGDDLLQVTHTQAGSNLLALASGGPGTNTIADAQVVQEAADDDFVVTKLASGSGAWKITGTGTTAIMDDLFGTTIPKVRLLGGPNANTLDAWSYDGKVELDGAAGGDTLRGSHRSDVLRGGPGSDRIEAWNDDFAQDVDTIACGSELDYVTTDVADTVDPDCEDLTWHSFDANSASTPAGPLQVTVTGPIPITIHLANAAPSATAWSFLGKQVDITAPTATQANPITIVFLVDATLLPAGVTAANLDVFRNGVLVGPCTGPAGQAVPTPCVSARQMVGTSAKITVLTAAASAWTFGVPLLTRGGVGGALQSSNGIAATLLAASDGKKVTGALAFGSYRSTSAVALAISGRRAWLAGLGSDGRPYLAYLEDNGPQGRGDVFRLWIGGEEQTTDGKLAKGDIAVTR
jgi:Tol biopolymer transport system component